MTAAQSNLIYAHGFEGRPNGTKARYLVDVLGHRLIAPEMHRYGWTFEDHVATVLTALDENPDIRCVVGSSMGGFATAVALSRRPDRDVSCVLMAPAVGLHAVWAELLGDDGLTDWRDSGVRRHAHAGVGRDVELPFALWSQCRDEAQVVVRHPCVIIHGRNDEVVPFANSEALAERSPGVNRLLASDDGHRLSNSLHLLEDALGLLEFG